MHCILLGPGAYIYSSYLKWVLSEDFPNILLEILTITADQIFNYML